MEWKQEWFSRVPRSHWQSMDNQKKVLDEIAMKLNIKNPKDWGKVTKFQFYELGATSLLNSYGSSPFACIKSIYKGFSSIAPPNFQDIDWKKDWFSNIPHFPRSHWTSLENRKKFLDELAVKLNIKNPSDWGKVKTHRIVELGGSSVLKHHNGSLLELLRSSYTGFHLMQTNYN